MGPRSVDTFAPGGSANGSLRAARVGSLRAAQRMSGCAPSPLASRPPPLAPSPLAPRPYALRPYAGARPANCR